VVSISNDAPALFPAGVATVVTWTACDAAGNCASCEQTVDVNCPPTCSITYAPASPTTDDAIVFSSNASDVDGTIVSVAWDFGDGDTAMGDPATHQYAMPGTYTVTATVCDNDGLCATCTADVTVDKGTNIPPECGDPAITTTPDPPVATQPVTLESNAWDPNPWGVIVSYEWDFGDGGTASGNPVTHTFAEAICYTVCVTVTDDQGGVTECCEQVCVRPLCDCDVAIDRTHCKMPAAGHVGQCKRGQIGARNLSATEPCDVILRVTDNAGNVVFESDVVTIEAGRRIRLRFDHCYTADEIGRNMWKWEVYPAQCNELTPWNNEYLRKVIVHP
jgi:PKD repeat protein